MLDFKVNMLLKVDIVKSVNMNLFAFRIGCFVPVCDWLVLFDVFVGEDTTTVDIIVIVEEDGWILAFEEGRCLIIDKRRRETANRAKNR